MPCASGVICNVEGTVAPCNINDLPTPYEPIVMVGGNPLPAYELSLVNRPRSLSIDECLQLNFAKTNEEFIFGELIPPYIDVLGRGPHLRRTDQSSVKYQSHAKCYHNARPHGSLLYQHISAFYGPNSQEQLLSTDRINFIGREASTCKQGFQLMNSSLVKPEHKIVYTNPEYDYEGGYDVLKCPVYDEDLGCYIDPLFLMHKKGGCCDIDKWTERAIFLSSDQYYKGTCVSDEICAQDSTTAARLCPEGIICNEGSTNGASVVSDCADGYVCPSGTTRDSSLNVPWGQYLHLCTEGYFCGGGTAMSKSEENTCPSLYFCPTGSASAHIGSLANDSLRRSLKPLFIDPFKNQVNLRYMG